MSDAMYKRKCDDKKGGKFNTVKKVARVASFVISVSTGGAGGPIADALLGNILIK